MAFDQNEQTVGGGRKIEEVTADIQKAGMESAEPPEEKKPEPPEPTRKSEEDMNKPPESYTGEENKEVVKQMSADPAVTELSRLAKADVQSQIAGLLKQVDAARKALDAHLESRPPKVSATAYAKWEEDHQEMLQTINAAQCAYERANGVGSHGST